jgi:hypothetical protein
MLLVGSQTVRPPSSAQEDKITAQGNGPVDESSAGPGTMDPPMTVLEVAGRPSLRGALGGISAGGVVGSVGGGAGSTVGAPLPGSAGLPGGTVVPGAGAGAGLPTRGSPVGGPTTELGVRAGGGAFVIGA